MRNASILLGNHLNFSRFHLLILQLRFFIDCVAIGTKWGICSLTCSLRISWFSTCRLLRATVIPVAYTASFYPTVNDTAYCPADKLSRDTLIYVIQPNVFLYQTVYIMLYLYIPESSVISLWYSFARIQVMSS